MRTIPSLASFFHGLRGGYSDSESVGRSESIGRSVSFLNILRLWAVGAVLMLIGAAGTLTPLAPSTPTAMAQETSAQEPIRQAEPRSDAPTETTAPASEPDTTTAIPAAPTAQVTATSNPNSVEKIFDSLPFELTIYGRVNPVAIGWQFLEPAEVLRSGNVDLYNGVWLDGSEQTPADAYPNYNGNGGFTSFLLDSWVGLRAYIETDEGSDALLHFRLDTDANRIGVEYAYIEVGVGRPQAGKTTIGWVEGVQYGSLAHNILAGYQAWYEDHTEFMSDKTYAYIDRLAGADIDFETAGQVGYTSPKILGIFELGYAFKPSTLFGGEFFNQNQTAANNSGNCNLFSSIRSLPANDDSLGCYSFDMPAYVDDANKQLGAGSGMSYIHSFGGNYLDTFGDVEVEAGASFIIGNIGQPGARAGSLFAMRYGLRASYQNYTGVIGVVYGNERPFVRTNKEHRSYVALSAAARIDFDPILTSFGIGWQRNMRYIAYTQEAFNFASQTERINPYLPLLPQDGIAVSGALEYRIANGVSLVSELTYVVGLPGDYSGFKPEGYGTLTAVYNLNALSDDGRTPATPPTGAYPSSTSLLLAMGMRIDF